MAKKGSVRIVPVDFVDNKLEKRALFLRYKALPEQRLEFKEWSSRYLLDLACADLSNDIELLKEQDKATETKESDKRLDKFSQTDIEAYLERKKTEGAADNDADE